MLNMDFSKAAIINTAAMDWVASPSPGVWRKPLARAEAERGHATSIVKYDPGASFRQHNHPLGEEILVLDGVFSDQTGDYPAGSYLRNPKGFEHAPFSQTGCVLLVKLHQFQTSDSLHVCIKSDSAQWLKDDDTGIKILPLHHHKTEEVMLVDWPAHAEYSSHLHDLGEEIYIISGEMQDEFGSYPAGSWIRYPDGSKHSPKIEIDTKFWVKAGHLPLA